MKVCVDALMFTSTTDFCPAKTAVPPRYVAGAVELRAWLQTNVEPYKEMMTMSRRGCTPCLPCFEAEPATDGFTCDMPQCQVRSRKLQFVSTSEMHPVLKSLDTVEILIARFLRFASTLAHGFKTSWTHFAFINLTCARLVHGV